MNPRQFDASKIKITPEHARELLLLNKGNRPLVSHHVKRLTQEMKEGRWKFNGDPIRISVSNRLLDGQHKLHAIVMSNTTQEILLVRGLPDDVFDTIDVGRKRTGSDIFAIMGEKNTSQLTSALNILTNFAEHGMNNRRVSYPVTVLEDTLDQHPTIRHSISFLANYKGRLMPQSCAAALHYLFTQKDALLADSFFEALTSGANLSQGDPVFLLRERLIANCAARQKYDVTYIMAISVKAWNAMRTKKSLRVLGWRGGEESPEQFPIIK